MLAAALLLGLATFAIDTGWKPVSDTELEYIIQIGPELFEELRKNPEGITSVIHPDARGVKRFRVIVGSGPLPRQGLPVPPPDFKPTETPDFGGPASDSGLDFPEEQPGLNGPETDSQTPVAPAEPDKTTARTPNLLDSSKDSARPLKNGEQTAAYEQADEDEEDDSVSASDLASESDKQVESLSEKQSAPSKPWLPLLATLVGLAGSIAANVYLAALWLETRRRCRELSAEAFSKTA